MRASDWLLLIVIALVVATCGVVGTSYVSGQGEPTFDLTETAILIGIFTVVAAVVIFLVDKLFAWVFRTRHAELPPESMPAPLPDGAPYPYPADFFTEYIVVDEHGTEVTVRETFDDADAHGFIEAIEEVPFPEPDEPNAAGAPRVSVICFGPKDKTERRPIRDLARYPLYELDHVAQRQFSVAPEQVMAHALDAAMGAPVDPALLDDSVPLHAPAADATVAADAAVPLPDPAFTAGAPAHAAHAAQAAAAAPQPKRTFLGRITPAWRPTSIIIFCAIMALFWAPWFIASFPGGTYWDTYYQIFQIYPENHPIAIIPWAEIYDQTLTDAWLVDHHPVLTTLLYGAFGWVSDQLTGNWMAGVAAFCVLQGIATIVAFTCAIAYLRQRGCPIVLCFLAYVFFCIMPFISTWAMCMVKDSLFGVLCVPYFIMLFEAVRTRGQSLSSVRAIVLFVIVGLLLCLTRKMGIFMVVPTALIAALTLRPPKGMTAANFAGIYPDAAAVPPTKPRSAAVACLAQALTCVLVMGLLLPYVIFPLAHIAPGGAQETLGPLFQQTARYLRDHGDEISVQEKRAITAVLDYDKLADQYQYDFADSVKYRYNLDATPEQLVDYLHAWATMGARHPDSYLAAFASLAGFYVAPTAYANIRMVTVDTHMGPDDRYMLWNPPELDELRHGLDDAYTAVAEMPGVDLPLLIVTYAFWLPACLIFICARRRLRAGTLLVPSLIMLGFVLISPVYDARYCVPIFDLAPLLICAFGAIGATMYSKYAATMDWTRNTR